MALKTTHSDEASEIHISESEALRLDFPTVLTLVRKGARIVIDGENTVVVISPLEAEAVAAREPFLRVAPDASESSKPVGTAVEALSKAVPMARIASTVPSPRKLSEVIALLPEDSEAVMDADFARDVEEAIASHREPLKSAWE